MEFRQDDINRFPYKYEQNEYIVFISERDTKPYYTKVKIHKILLSMFLIGTVVVFFAELHLLYSAVGIILSIYEKSVIDNYRKYIIINEERKLFLTNQRVVIRGTKEERWYKKKGRRYSQWEEFIYIDNIVKVVEMQQGGVSIHTDSDNGNMSYYFDRFDNITEFMDIITPWVAKRHAEYK